jgi:anaerobic selenocysteine-containing dehydrogenase
MKTKPAAIMSGAREEGGSGDQHDVDDRSTGQMDRKRFIGTSALVGTSGLLARRGKRRKYETVPVGDYVLAQPENILYSTCLQCHVTCQIKAKIWDGTLAKLTGNPYSPQNYLPHLDYASDLGRVARTDGKLCPKGQSGIQTYGDPYRIRRVLKRAGPRGSGRWVSIPFDRFVDEVVEGGQLFQSIDDTRHYPGFQEVWALRDRDVAGRMATDAAAFASGDMTLEAFKEKHREYLDLLIDPDHPDLGPKNNGFVFDAGRIQHGRKELMAWFTRDSLGSVNYFEHTTICEQSHHIAFRRMTGGDNNHMKPDLLNAEFVIFWGTGAFTANFGLTPMAEKVTSGRVDRGMKTAVVDPRLSNDAAKADWWLPVKPGADGALAQAMIRWIIENERYDAAYLENANAAAAAADREPSWTNATHLVKVDGDRGVALLRASEAGLAGGDRPVVVSGGRLRAVDPTDTAVAVEGELFVERVVNGIPVKSAFQLLYDEAGSRTFEEYEAITGIETEKVAAVARELTAHGKKAAVESYRGPVQHTDGYYAGVSVTTLNVLIGNSDWKGGLAKGGGYWHEFGGQAASVHDWGSMHPSKAKAWGPPITREKTSYESTSLFRENGYPADRPWYPLTSNVYQEVVPSFAAGYPYGGRILFLSMGTPALSIPAGNRLIETLRDPDRIPLFIVCDVVVGETSMYADYIVPDLTYLERWGTPHVSPDIVSKVSKVRQPVAKPLTEEVVVDGESMPISLEAFLIAVGKRLDLPGFGGNGLGDFPFDRPEDWYLKLVANMAMGDKLDEQVPDASDAEMRIFRASHRHLPPSIFDEARWRAAVRPEEWRKVVYVLNRGGRFAPLESGYSGDVMARRFGKMWLLFSETVANTRNSMSGEPFYGTPVYRGQTDAGGRALDGGGRYPLSLITYKEPFGGHSRTISNYWSNVALRNENRIVVNRRDAEALGFEDGQRVRMVSAANPNGQVVLGDGRIIDVVGELQAKEGIRPGVVAVSWHYGHWAYGSNDIEVDGADVLGDRRRAAGLCPNMVMAVDPGLRDVCLTDPIGGSSSFFDTMVDLVPV